MDCIVVEVPLISMVSFDHIVEEDVPPLGADDGISEFVCNDWVRPVDIEVVQKVEATGYFSEGLMIELIHWACVDAEVACNVFEMIASSCQCDFSSNSVSSQGCH